MRTFTTVQLENMEIINLCDGARLGCAEAFELDIDHGCGSTATITAILVPCATGLASFLSFGKREVFRIPWCRVECVVQDTILVKLTDSELTSCRCRAGK